MTTLGLQEKLNRHSLLVHSHHGNQLNKHHFSGILSVCKEFLGIYYITSVYCKHTLQRVKRKELKYGGHMIASWFV